MDEPLGDSWYSFATNNLLKPLSADHWSFYRVWLPEMFEDIEGGALALFFRQVAELGAEALVPVRMVGNSLHGIARRFNPVNI